MIDRIGVLDEYGVYFTASCATTPLISPAFRTHQALTVDYPPHPISFVLTVAGVPFDKTFWRVALLKRMESIIEQGKVCTADHSCCGCLCVAPILGASPLPSLRSTSRYTSSLVFPVVLGPFVDLSRMCAVAAAR